MKIVGMLDLLSDQLCRISCSRRYTACEFTPTFRKSLVTHPQTSPPLSDFVELFSLSKCVLFTLNRSTCVTVPDQEVALITTARELIRRRNIQPPLIILIPVNLDI